MARTGFKRPGRYAALAAAYYDDPAIIAVGPDAELWYVRALAGAQHTPKPTASSHSKSPSTASASPTQCHA